MVQEHPEDLGDLDLLKDQVVWDLLMVLSALVDRVNLAVCADLLDHSAND
jgi:hypothetical protein